MTENARDQKKRKATCKCEGHEYKEYSDNVFSGPKYRRCRRCGRRQRRDVAQRRWVNA